MSVRVQSGKTEATSTSQACPLCGAPASPWFTMPIDPKTALRTTHGSILRCRDCRFAFVHPRPSSEEVADFYRIDSYYTHEGSHFEEPEPSTILDRIRVRLAWISDNRYRFGIDQLGRRPSSVCDIGAGHGEFVQESRRLGVDACAVEPDPRARQVCLDAGLVAHEGTAEELPDPVTSRHFELVHMSHSLEHCLDPCRAVRSVRDILTPGGLFVCEVPNAEWIGFLKLGAASETLDVPRHLNFFTTANLVALLELNGFEVQALYYTGFTRHFRNDWMATEQRIAGYLREAHVETRYARNTRALCWWLLARSVLAPRRRRYDSVGAIAARAR